MNDAVTWHKRTIETIINKRNALHNVRNQDLLVIFFNKWRLNLENLKVSSFSCRIFVYHVTSTIGDLHFTMLLFSLLRLSIAH